MPTALTVTPANTALTGTPLIAQAEIDFFRRAETRFWWQARHRQGLARATPVWLDRCLELAVAPMVAGQLPSVVTGAGPNGSDLVRGLGTDPAGALISASGTVVVPNGQDWTLWGVSKAGSTATARLGGVAGSNGGGLYMVQRSSNLFQVSTRDAAGVATQRISATCPSAEYVLWSLAWQQSTGTLNYWLNGTSTLSVAGVPLIAHSQRLTMLGFTDLVTGQDVSSGRSLDICAFGVAHTYAPGNATWRAALKAMVNAVYPAITVA